MSVCEFVDAGPPVGADLYAGRHRAPCPPGPVTIALLPAYNEAAGIAAAVRGLHTQSVPPDEVVVVANNCTDDTAQRARAAGAHVLELPNNPDKKAGALNWALAAVLPRLSSHDRILVMDADSILDAAFLETAAAYLDEGYGGVGGTFRGGPGGGFVGHLQRNEFARYQRDVNRLGGRCLVLTGTAAMFSVATLRAVSEARLCGLLPAGNGHGGVYDTTVLTEDNELTFALLHLGRKVIAPAECTLVTEVMPTWRALWRQRLRWKRGAVENCAQYGLTRITWQYWGRQVVTALGIVVSTLYLGTLAYGAATGRLVVHPYWLTLTGVFMLERVVTVRYRGWPYMLAAALMYELVFEYFLQACHAWAYACAATGRERSW
ncbi:MAG: glycosyltransferase family 2 protein [Acidothermales bacterium]|nr:glycosyltransferase family 2 protein [Acidothermales bacterium]